MDEDRLFDIPMDGLRVVVTGQVGIDKKPFLEQVVSIAQEQDTNVTLCNVGDMMYAEAPDVAPGRILDLPISRLDALRRAVFRDILALAEKSKNIIVNTHATFRWRHGLFPAFDHDLIKKLQPNLFITLVDNVDAMHFRLLKDHEINHSLKDLLVWREEEILATEILATITRGRGCFYVMARGNSVRNVETMYKLIFKPNIKRVYASFPMSHVSGQVELQNEIDKFRRILHEHFVCFDPGDLEEKRLHDLAIKAAEENNRYVTVKTCGEEIQLEVAQILSVVGDIHGQIYARDFKFIEQSDMIISYIPADSDGRPLLSSGVERELQHAYESTKEAYVIWRSHKEPSPFITETATRVFADIDEAMEDFQSKSYITIYQRQM